MALSTDPTTQDALSMIVQSYNKQVVDPTLHLNDLDFVFEDPIPRPVNDTFYDTNTILNAKPIATSGKVGMASVYYDRIDLALLDGDVKPTLTRDGNTTLADILTQINEYYQFNLVARDVPLNTVITGPTVTIAATTISYMFIGQVTFTFAV